MQAQRYRFTKDWVNGALLGNVYLDTIINVSSFNHPALTSGNVVTSTNTVLGAAALVAALGGSVPAGATSYTLTPNPGLWASMGTAGTPGAVFMVTSEAMDALSFTTSALNVIIQLTGVLGSGSGAVVGAGFVTNGINNGCVANIFVDGSLVQSVDTYLASPTTALYLDGNPHIIKIQHSGTYNAALPPASTTMLAIWTIQLGFGSSGGGGSTYTSAVIDSGAQDTQWVLANWTEQSGPMLHFALSTGNTPTPDGSWQTYTTTPSTTLLPTSLTNAGCAGLEKATRGRYAQWVMTFPASTSAPPFIRDLTLYWWVPERDPHFLGHLGMAQNWTPGPNISAYLGAVACHLTDLYLAAQDQWTSYAIGQSVDQYLTAYGLDMNLVQYTGETPEGYRARILSAFQSHGNAGSRPFIAAQVAALTGFLPSQISVFTLPGSYQYGVTLPPPVATPAGTYYPGLIGVPITQALAIINTFITTILRPVTSVFNATAHPARYGSGRYGDGGIYL
jgi:hypothetical protein